eukprot:scaffold303766_cov39-Tisochrysis_lutea.AAC.1
MLPETSISYSGGKDATDRPKARRGKAGTDCLRTRVKQRCVERGKCSEDRASAVGEGRGRSGCRRHLSTSLRCVQASAAQRVGKGREGRNASAGEKNVAT